MLLREVPVPLSDERRRRLVEFLAGLGLTGLGLTDPLNPDLDLAPIEEALTHSSAGRPSNHERLEFLGDAVLRLAAAEYLERHHRAMDVGQRSALRAQLVSDRWLAELAERCGIEAMVHLGPVAAGDSAARQTIRAEICEALIGGLYEATGSLAAVHSWLTPTGNAAPVSSWPIPTATTGRRVCRSGARLRGSACPAISAKNAAASMATPDAFTAA